MKLYVRHLSILICILTLLSMFSIPTFAVSGTINPPPVIGEETLETLPFQISGSFSSQIYDAQSKTIEIHLPNDTDKIKLTFSFNTGMTGKIYADVSSKQALSLTKANSLTLKPTQKHTYLYLVCNKTKYTLNVISTRSPMEYRDDRTIANWARTYIDYCNQLGYGIIQGDKEQNANPDKPLSRYEIATIAARVLGTDCSLYPSQTGKYQDEIQSWAVKSVSAMTKLGIIGGHKEKKGYFFNGNDNVTREQVCKIMVELALLKEGNKKTATQLYRASQKSYDKKLAAFSDTSEISDWARPYVALAVCKYEFISGSDENGKLYLRPLRDISRQEMTVIIARELGYDIDIILSDLINRVQNELATTKLSESELESVRSAYSKATKAFRNGNTEKKESAYVKLYNEARTLLYAFVVYLSPSNQIRNEYTGVTTTEGAQMQAVADLLKPMLEKQGFIVYIADPNSTIYTRQDDAKEKGADIYVAIHSNATAGGNDGSAQGSIVYHSNNEGSEKLAKKVSYYLSKLTPTTDKGIHNDSYADIPFHEIKAPEMANILAEVEFHDYPTYANWIVSHKKELAKAFANGIWDYFYK